MLTYLFALWASFYFLERIKEHSIPSLEGGILLSTSERYVTTLSDYDMWVLWHSSGLVGSPSLVILCPDLEEHYPESQAPRLWGGTLVPAEVQEQAAYFFTEVRSSEKY